MDRKLLLTGVLCLWGFWCYGQGLPDYSWSVTFGDAAGDPSDEVNDVARDGDGNVYAVGGFYEAIDLDPSPLSGFLGSMGGEDGFVAKYDSTGQLVWTFALGGVGTENPRRILVSADQHLLILGIYSSVVDFDPGPGVQSLTPVGDYDLFFAKYTLAGDLVWVKSIGGSNAEYASAIVESDQGNLFITGETYGTVDYDPSPGVYTISNPGGNADIFFAKYNAQGDLIWAHELVGNNADGASDMVVNDLEEITIVGQFGSSAGGGTCDFDPGPGNVTFTATGNTDAFIATYSGQGNFLWATATDGSNAEYWNGVGHDSQGNVYVTGSYRGTPDFDGGPGTASHTSAGQSDLVLAKYDGNGNYLWSRSIGGSSHEAGIRLMVGEAGDLYFGGQYSNVVDFDPGVGVSNLSSGGSVTGFVARFTQNGTFIWANSLGGGNNGVCMGLYIGPRGGIHVGGYFSNTFDFDPGPGSAVIAPTTNWSLFVGTYDSTGAYGWVRSSLDRQGGNDDAMGVAQDGQGNIYTTGRFRGEVDFDPLGSGFMVNTQSSHADVYLAKHGGNGVLKWARNFGGPEADVGEAVQLDGTGGVYVLGTFMGVADFDPGPGVQTLTANGASRDMFLVKYDSTGNYQWAFSMGGTAHEVAGDMAVDSSGNVYVTGAYSGNVDFDPGPGSFFLSSPTGQSYGYVAKYGTGGNLVWAKPISGIASGKAIAVDSLENVYVGGAFSGSVDFDPGPGSLWVSSWGSNDAFVAKYKPNGDLDWGYGIGGTGYDEGRAITLLTGGKAVLNGVFSGTVDFDPDPIASQTLSSTNAFTDIFLVQFDGAGDFQWAKGMGSTQSEDPTDLTSDADGNLYMVGCFFSVVDLDPGPGNTNMSSAGGSDAFFASYDAQGNYRYGISQGGYSLDSAGAISVDALGRIAYVGSFRSLTDLDPSSGVDEKRSKGRNDAFLVYLGACVSAQPPIVQNTLIQAVCDTTVAMLHVANAQAGVRWDWYADQCGGGVLHQGDSLTVNIRDSTTYYVRANGACATLNGCTEVLVPVQERPDVSAGISSVGQLVCMGELVTVQANGASTYQWSGGVSEGVPFAATTSQTFTVTGTAANGCTDTANVYLSVSPNPPPVVGIGVSPNDSVCAGETVSLSGNGAQQYQWSAGVVDGLAFTPLVTQTYQLVGTDAFGCSDSASVLIEVIPIPVLTATISPDDTVCTGTTVQLTGSGAPSLVWSGGIANGVPFVANTTQTYSMIGIGVSGCADTLTLDLAVIPNPTVNVSLSPNDSVCEGTPLILAANGAHSYTVLGGNQLGVPFSLNSSQVLQIIGIDLDGCVDTVALPVVVHATPVLTVSASPNDTVCAGSPLQLTVNGAANVVWTGGVVNGVPFAASSSQTYFAWGTSLEGCTSTIVEDVTVLALPVLSVTVSPNDTVCIGTSVTLTGSGANNLVWSNGVGNGLPFVVNGSQTYVLTGLSAEGCENTYVQPLTVVGGVSYVEPQGSVCLEGGTVQLSGGMPAGGSYTGTGVTGGQFDPQLAGLGLHALVYTVTNGLGCTGSDTSWIEVMVCPGVGSGIEGGGLKVFPNPGHGLYQVDWRNGNGDAVHCGVLNGLGQVVTELEWIGDLGIVDLRALAEGVYILKVTRGEETAMRRVVKLGN